MTPGSAKFFLAPGRTARVLDSSRPLAWNVGASWPPRARASRSHGLPGGCARRSGLAKLRGRITLVARSSSLRNTEGVNFDPVVNAIRSAIPEVQALYLFGSVATGQDRSDSDVDLAVLAPRPLDQLSRWRLQESIAAELGRDVDLVDLRAASTVMQVQVLDTGRVLFEADASSRALFARRRSARTRDSIRAGQASSPTSRHEAPFMEDVPGGPCGVCGWGGC